MARNVVALAFLVLFCGIVGIREPRFFTSQSIESVLLWMPLITVVAMGQLLVIVTGGIDISVGSILGFAGIGAGLFLQSAPALPIPLVFIIGLTLGLVLGVINAAVFVWARVPPLIVTIGTLASFRGLTFLVSKGDQIDSTVIPSGMTSLANTGVAIGGTTINWLLVIALSISAVMAIVLRNMAGGRNVFAFGSSPTAAHLRGISSKSVLFWVYSVCGALSGLAGVMYASRFGFVNPGSAGQNFELTVIAAVVIGGTKLTGGVGSVFGVLIGCLLLSCINVGLAVMGVDANWQMLAYGTVILAAVLVDGFAERRRA